MTNHLLEVYGLNLQIYLQQMPAGQQKIVTGKTKEYLTLFLEHAYVSELPKKKAENAYKLVFSLLKKKATDMAPCWSPVFIISNIYAMN